MAETDFPYLSVVVCARNDNHGEDFLNRMQMFVSALLTQAADSQLSMELIIVEWNPPTDMPRLAEVLTFPVGNSQKVRFIEVPLELHANFGDSEKLPLHQMIAKNVGIRRALGEFVLATNVDLVFTPELIKFFAKKQLQHRRLYRVDRYDVAASVTKVSGLDEQLAYSRQNIIRVHSDQSVIYRTERRAAQRIQSHSLYKLYFFARHVYGVGSLAAWRKLTAFTVEWFGDRVAFSLPRLHLHACGDFTLMSKEDWSVLHGYPEFPYYPLHIDSLLCYMAHFQGIKQTILTDPLHVYHAEHGDSSGDNTISVHQRMKQRKIAVLGFPEVRALAYAMKRGQHPIQFNDEEWGLGMHELSQHTIIKRPATTSLSQPRVSAVS